MNHRNCFEALDKSLKDILNTGDSQASEKPFGRMVVLLEGYFRHILLVMVRGSRMDTIDASISRSYLWDYCTVFSLKTNMCLLNDNMDEESRISLIDFTK